MRTCLNIHDPVCRKGCAGNAVCEYAKESTINKTVSETPRTGAKYAELQYYLSADEIAVGYALDEWQAHSEIIERELNAANARIKELEAKLATARDDVAMRSAVYLIYFARLAAGKMKRCNSNPPHAEVDWFMENLNELDVWCDRFGVISLDYPEAEAALAPLRSLKSSSGG